MILERESEKMVGCPIDKMSAGCEQMSNNPSKLSPSGSESGSWCNQHWISDVEENQKNKVDMAMVHP